MTKEEDSSSKKRKRSRKEEPKRKTKKAKKDRRRRRRRRDHRDEPTRQPHVFSQVPCQLFQVCLPEPSRLAQYEQRSSFAGE
jgi:hypothetical protein